MRAPGASQPVEPKKDESQLSGDTRLLGVFAERDGQGYALFRLSSGPRLVGRGQEIAQGATLVAVRPDGITIRDAGGERRIVLRGEPPPKAAPATTAMAAKSPRNPACVPPPGFKGTILRLNAELFQGIIGKPESWAAIVVPDQGALAVRDDSGFVAMLAMKKGDRLLQANGVPLSAPDDVVRAVLRPLASQQPVRVTGTRDGAPREWLLLNAGTCPA
jgi:type II secretory pathway component PulC